MRTLLPLSRCAQICGLQAKELIVGARPRAEHRRLAARYRRCSEANKQVMRVAMVQAIRAAVARSAFVPAAELLTALRLMLSAERRDAACVQRGGARGRRANRQTSRQPLPIWPDRRPKGREEAQIYCLAEWRKVASPGG